MTNLRLFQTERADDNFDFNENGSKLSKQVENTVGKREIARYEQFLLFPQCLKKRLVLQTCKIGWLVVLGFNTTLTAKVISWQSVTHNYVFPGFLTPVLT